jgi:hypothetical protein
MEPIYELLDCCTVDVLDTETIYKPLGAPPDKVVSRQLDIAQGGAYFFHRALQRSGKAQVKGDA